MSILIDDLVNLCKPGNCSYRRVGIRKYIAKPRLYIGLSTIIKRIKDSIRVLIGKSQAYHYWEDTHEIS